MATVADRPAGGRELALVQQDVEDIRRVLLEVTRCVSEILDVLKGIAVDIDELVARAGLDG